MTISLSTKEDLYGPDFDAEQHSSEDLYQLVRQRLATHHACYIRNFPTSVKRFTQFVAQFGDLLSNYSSNDGVASDPDSLHPCVNRVKYKQKEGDATFVHEKGGALPLHSARSWRKIRPSYFAMLMVDPGWTNQEEGNNGESIVVRWRDVLQVLHETDPALLAHDLRLLSGIPLHFRANHVVEDFSDLPLIYRLQSSSGEFDLGVRMKSDIFHILVALREEIEQYEVYVQALERFVSTANRPDVCVRYQMHGGDIVLLDNNRFGHGRLNFLASREQKGTISFNPRELWSVTIA